MASRPLINSFNAGELSPYLYARSDLSKYNSGCLTLENMSVLPYGGVVSRPNIKFVAESKSDDKVRLISFEFSASETYVIELGDLYARFYTNSTQIQGAYSAWVTSTAYAIGDLTTEGGSYYRCLEGHTSGTFATDLTGGKWEATTGATDFAYEIPSPWAAADVYGLKFVQSADVMWFVHPDYPVYKLSRLSGTNWTLEEVTFDYPALLEPNATSTTITSSATTGSVTLTSSSDIFDANQIGGYFEINHPRSDNVLGTLDGTDSSAPYEPPTPAGTNTLSGRGTIIFTTTGNWYDGSGAYDVAVWRSDDGGTTWSKFREYNLDNRNVDATWEESDSSAIYAVTSATNGSGSIGKFKLSVGEYYTKGLVKITAVAGGTSATATVIETLGDTVATATWTEGAWSAFRGYPKACAIWESRLIFAGTLSNPNTLWLSRIDDFENFEEGTLDDDAMRITIGSGLVDEIVWLVPQSPLVIGTSGSEWVLEAQSDNKPVTPSEFSLKRKTTYGSKDLQATLVNSAVLLVMRQGRKIREFTYRFDVDDYVAPDLSILAEHITDGGIVTSAYQQQPDNVLHLIRADGTLIPMTYERDQEVTAFARWTIDGGDGNFESIAVIARNADEDQVWTSCSLTVDGVTRRYIGYFDNREWGTDVATEWSGSDFYTVFNSPASTTLTGLGYFEGKTVDILRDGLADPQQVVTGGQITLTKSGASRVVVGLPRTCTMAPIYIEPAMQFMQSMGKKKGLFKAVIRFKDTIGAKVGQSLDKLETVFFRTTGDAMDTQVALFSGEKKIRFDNTYEFLHTCYVVQDKPLPIAVIAMIPYVEVKE